VTAGVNPGTIRAIMQAAWPFPAPLPDGELSWRCLSDLRGVFSNATALEAAIAKDDALVYAVCAASGPESDGELAYGIGVICPGAVGGEFYLTKGHVHAWREAAEVYIGLAGRGLMVLQEEDGRGARTEELAAGTIVYVPGRTAHRTVNTGAEPLVYLGVYPSTAGHDYAALLPHGFTQRIMTGPSGWRSVLARHATER
jgi:glucose-6-phosphate isomerase